MFCRICLLAVVLVFTGGQTQECIRCPTGFSYFARENKCYKVVTGKVAWNEAFNTCSRLGAHLAVVKNAEANMVLRTVFQPFKGSCSSDVSKGTAYWTAGRYPCGNIPPFKWSTGSGNLFDIEYYNWRKDEPNNQNGNENCIHMIDDGKDDFVFNDIPCSNKYCSICEIDI